MKIVENIRDILIGVWCIGIIIRIFSKITDLYEMPEWDGYFRVGIILIVLILSLYIYIRKKRKNETAI